MDINKIKNINLFRIAALLIASNFYGNSVQFFNVATYKNPAAMQRTADTNLETGALLTNVYNKFKGNVSGVEGTIKTDNTLLLPYGIFSHRLSSKIVAGVDVSNPVLGYILWPINGFQKNFGIDANLLSYQISPRLSFAITDKFSLGVSLQYFSLWRTELNYAVLDSYMVNRGTGDSWGGSVGFWWMINQTNFFDACYYSPISVTLKGTSASGLFVNSNFKFLNFKYSPGTLLFNYVHIFTQRILVSANLTYSFWNVDKELILKNTALGPNPTVFTLDWKNTFSASLFGRFQTTQKTALMLIAGFDESLVNSGNNVVSFPIGNLFFGGIGGEYLYNEKAGLKLMLSQGRVWRPKIHNPPGIVDGTSNAVYTLLDFGVNIRF